MINWNGSGRKPSWPNLRYYFKICVEGVRKITNHLSQDSPSPGRNFNPGPPEYKAGVSVIRLRRSVQSLSYACHWSCSCSFIVFLFSELQKPYSLVLEPGIIFHSCDICFCNILAETNKAGFDAVLSCVVSDLQKISSLGLEPRLILFPGFVERWPYQS
jgi:hypothetical protein